MRTIGLTYDLRDDYLAQGFGEEETAEFDRLDTIEGIAGALTELGYACERIGNVKSLVGCLCQGKRWDMVFNICEGLTGIGREAQVPAILDAYGIPYTFSDPLVLSLTLHKGLTKRVIRDLGIPTADFFVAESPEDAAANRLPFPLFVKPVAEGTGKGIYARSRVRNRRELEQTLMELIPAFRQPALVETYLSGREYTVGIVGTGSDAEVLGAMEILLEGDAEAGAYSFANKKNYEEVVRYRLASGAVAGECEKLALAAWRGLGCRDGGRLDIRADDSGKLFFLEVNPLAGLNPVHSDLPIVCRLKGIPFVELIERIMTSAWKRA